MSSSRSQKRRASPVVKSHIARALLKPMQSSLTLIFLPIADHTGSIIRACADGLCARSKACRCRLSTRTDVQRTNQALRIVAHNVWALSPRSAPTPLLGSKWVDRSHVDSAQCPTVGSANDCVQCGAPRRDIDVAGDEPAIGSTRRNSMVRHNRAPYGCTGSVGCAF